MRTPVPSRSVPSVSAVRAVAGTRIPSLTIAPATSSGRNLPGECKLAAPHADHAAVTSEGGMQLVRNRAFAGRGDESHILGQQPARVSRLRLPPFLSALSELAGCHIK